MPVAMAKKKRKKGRRFGKDFPLPFPTGLKVPPTPKDIARFIAFVELEPQTGCWLWTGHTDKRKGYGQFKQGGRMHWAHRWATLVFKGMPEVWKQAGHKHDICSNPHCVNPAHLQAEDVSDNAADANYRRYGTTPPPPTDDIPF